MKIHGDISIKEIQKAREKLDSAVVKKRTEYVVIEDETEEINLIPTCKLKDFYKL